MKLLIGLFFLCMPPAILCGKALSKAVPCIGTDAVAIPEHSVHYNARSTRPDGTGPINYQPEEVLLKIFECMDSVTLSNSQQVCSQWRRIIENETWRKKVGPVNGQMTTDSVPLRWEDYKRIYEMIKLKTNIWHTYYMHRKNEDLWPYSWGTVDPKIHLIGDEYTPGIRNLPSFVVQPHKPHTEVLNLVEAGLPAAYLDLRPMIKVIEWYNFQRANNPFAATGIITLLREDDSAMTRMRLNLAVTQQHFEKWIGATGVFKNYNIGLRKIRFERPMENYVQYGSGLYIIRG